MCWGLVDREALLYLVHYSDGSIYYGRMVENYREGYGKFYNKEGSYIYEGIWLADFEHEGKVRYANNDEYEGQFKYGLRYGEGAVRFADGGWYKGGFKTVYFNGIGEYHTAAGHYFKGHWQYGLLCGQGEAHSPTGWQFVGHFRLGKKHGEGKFCHPNKGSYNGRWLNGKKNGKFTFFEAKHGHLVAEGEYLHNQKHGDWKKILIGNQGNSKDCPILRSLYQRGKKINVLVYYSESTFHNFKEEENTLIGDKNQTSGDVSHVLQSNPSLNLQFLRKRTLSQIPEKIVQPSRRRAASDIARLPVIQFECLQDLEADAAAQDRVSYICEQDPSKSSNVLSCTLSGGRSALIEPSQQSRATYKVEDSRSRSRAISIKTPEIR